MKNPFVLSVLTCLFLAMHGAVLAADLAEAKQKFSVADKALNTQYQLLKRTLDKWSFAELQKDQRDWLGYRDALAERAGFDDGQQETPKDSPEYWSMSAGLTNGRLAVLKGYQKLNQPAKWSGIYRDSYGGLIKIQEKNGKIHFEINVVRGPTHHIGEIDGTGVTNKTAARFTDGGADHKEDGETWLDFEQLDGARIRVKGINTHFYHGARASFDGVYVKVTK
ncbi:MAG: lysozyme inhibitor LprI family protein [Akkermansiaceae bacterium]